MVYNFFLFFSCCCFQCLDQHIEIKSQQYVLSDHTQQIMPDSTLCFVHHILYMSTKGYIYIYVEVIFYIYNKVIRSEIESKYWRFHLSLSQWIFGWMVCYAGLLGWFWMGGVVELLLFSSIQKWTYIYFC